MRQKLGVVSFLLLVLLGCAQPDQANENSVEGQEAPKIFGGELSQGTTAIEKSVVGIYSDEEGGFLCTGTLISEKAVLTAAHCLTEKAQSIRILFGKSLNRKTLYRVVDQAVAHPSFRPKASKNQSDLALLFFKGGLPAGYSPAVRINSASGLRSGQVVTMLGFGINWILPGHSDDKKGAGVLRQVQLEILNSRYATSEIQIDQGLTKGTCNGDSGGPSFVSLNGESYFWGVGSRAAGMMLLPCVVDSIYTRVDMYRDWIDRVLESAK